MLPASTLYPSRSSQASARPSTPRRHSVGGVVRPAPAPLCAPPRQEISTPRRHSTGGLTSVPPQALVNTNAEFHTSSSDSPFTPRASLQDISGKSAFRQRSVKGTSIKTSIAASVEWIFLDADEMLSEVARISVPARSDMQRDRHARTADQMHNSWCPCGTSCAEHGGNWSGYRGCPYSIFIPPTVSTLPQFRRCDSPVRARSSAGDDIMTPTLMQRQQLTQAVGATHFTYYHTPLSMRPLSMHNHGSDSVLQAQLLMAR